MLKGLSYILLPCTDLARSAGFYRDVLGLPLVWLEKEQGHAAVQAGDVLLVLSTREPAKGGGGVVCAFDVEDIDAACATLREKGVVFPQGIDEHGGRRTARFSDPDGNLLELNQTKPPPQMG